MNKFRTAVCAAALLALAQFNATAAAAANVCATPGGFSLQNKPAPAKEPRDQKPGKGLGGTGVDQADRGIGGTGINFADRGIGGTGISFDGGVGVYGRITGFGSICVNGLEIHYDRKTLIEANGKEASATDFKIGQTVNVVAAGENGRLTAQSIGIDPAAVRFGDNIRHVSIEGYVDGKNGDRIIHMGQTAVVLPDRVEIHGGRREDISENARVIVFGERDAHGRIEASVIALEQGDRPPETDSDRSPRHGRDDNEKNGHEGNDGRESHSGENSGHEDSDHEAGHEGSGHGIETPETETPEVESPEVETPEVETPEVETPEVETPEVELPDMDDHGGGNSGPGGG